MTSTSLSLSVKTPNGSDVEVIERQEGSKEKIEEINKKYDSMYSKAERISSASYIYNCHSFAWYSQNIEANHYWMNSPTAYYLDGSYIEISYLELKERDRICYFDNEGYNLHSGIVLKIKNEEPNDICGSSNVVEVQSKWGACGLYQHSGDYCPYVSLYGGVEHM